METKMKKTCKNITWWIGVTAIGIVFGVSLQFAGAWVNPPAAAPPGGNLGGPINTSSVPQSKDGALGVEGILKAWSNLVVVGTLRAVGGGGIPGSFQFLDGNQKDGRVLTSDSNGNAKWKDAAANPISCTGTNKALQWDGSSWKCETISGGEDITDYKLCWACRIMNGQGDGWLHIDGNSYGGQSGGCIDVGDDWESGLSDPNISGPPSDYWVKTSGQELYEDTGDAGGVACRLKLIHK